MTPIENIIQDPKRGEDRYREWVLDYLAAMRKIREGRGEVSLVDYHKAKLGRQNRTFNNGEFRFWVWHVGAWMIFVSNFKGVCFEVPEGATQRIAFGAWQDYKERMGVHT